MSTPNDVKAEDYGAKHFIKFDADHLAAEVGNPKGANMIILGVLIGYTKLLPADIVLETIFKKLGAKHPEFNELNQKAFEKGLEIGRSAEIV